MPWTHRFLRQFLWPRDRAVSVEETEYERGGRLLPARCYRPARQRGALPAWVVLHGITRTGRLHRGLDRLARAYAAAGNLVHVPDVPEWRELRVAPAATALTIRAAVHAVQQRADVRHGRVGLLAFSFGATQAILAGADPDLAPLLHGIVAWGGYCDLYRAVRFGLTGVHELDGARFLMEPDPYGRWIMAANYLTAIPEYRDSGDVARALHALAIAAGERGIYAGDPAYDPLKLQLRQTLPPERHELFDYLAPPAHQRRRDDARARTLACQLAEAALRLEPDLDPGPRLAQLRVPVLLAHGRDDRLLPFSESVRLHRALPAELRRGCAITGLFAHSGSALSSMSPLARAHEAARFLHLMHRILNLV